MRGFIALACVATLILAIVEAEDMVLQTANVQVRFDAATTCITSISADFEGGYVFSKNILAAPLCLEIDQKLVPAQTLSAQKPKVSKVAFSPADSLQLSFEGSLFNVDLNATVLLYGGSVRLNPALRSVAVHFNGQVETSFTATNIGYGIYLASSSLYGLFENGVVQMKDHKHSCMSGQSKLTRFYALGEGSAADVLIQDPAASSHSVILSSSTMAKYHTALQYTVFGQYPYSEDGLNTAWRPYCWQDAVAASVPAGLSWSFDFTIIPNEYNFPPLGLNDITATSDNIPNSYLIPYLTGIYASPVGCLQSYYAKQVGIIAPTISHPAVSYAPDSNFFDPDNFISLSAMLYAGDEYLTQQVKNVLERTGDTMCGLGKDVDRIYCNGLDGKSSFLKSRGKTRDGQLMHHFIDLHPTYTSIAGSEQLGPNVFWTMMVIRFASVTQDRAWAQQMLPFVQLSTQFLLSFLDTDKQMIQAPGPLWIDVFVRENFTSDSNAMLIPFLASVAEFYDYLGVAGGDDLRAQSQRTIAAMNQYLLSPQGDHYITQLNPDGTSRDMVDYDANLMAVAFGIANSSLASSILKRVDSGEHTHIRATWPSEVIYSGSKTDCYSGSGNANDVCGDATVTMARIGWVDALACKRVGDVSMVKDTLLQPIVDDLLQSTWLYERYDANGNPAHNGFYFEYPSFVAMVLREVVYGINISPQRVEISPLTSDSFHFHIGNTDVDFSDAKVSLLLPGSQQHAQTKKVLVYHQQANQTYHVTGCDGKVVTATSDAQGLLQFQALFYDGCKVSATLA